MFLKRGKTNFIIADWLFWVDNKPANMEHGDLLKRLAIAVLLIFISTVSGYAQFSIQHQVPVSLIEGQENELTFSITGINPQEVQQARLFYRYSGEFSYSQQEVYYENGTFSVLFTPDNASANALEYYFEVSLFSDDALYYPANLPSQNPVEVEIITDESVDKYPKLKQVDYTILSPRPGSGVAQNDAVIALALFYDESALPSGAFKLFVDNEDVTEKADIDDYYVSYIPENLSAGPHNISLLYITEEQTFEVTKWSFSTVSQDGSPFQSFAPSRVPEIQAELTARNQVISGNVNNAYTGRTYISGAYGDFRYSVNGFLTSQESRRLQPQNRYGVRMNYGKWWELEAGHIYPRISPLTIAGRRVHGIQTSAHLLNEKINVQFLYGELQRKITNQYDSLTVQNVVNQADSVVDKNYILSYQDDGKGVFQRKITGVRLGFGNKEKFQWGFHALKIQDDTTSLFNVRNYRDVLERNSLAKSNLTNTDKDSLLANPNRLDVRTGAVRPRGNAVAGTTLNFGMADDKVRFESEVAISALNNDIYEGPLTVERADDMGFDINKKASDLLERLSWLIIVNENMNTLPFRIREGNDGNFNGKGFLPTSTLAGTGQLYMRGISNNFSVQYRWIGPNYNSLANSTVRKDVAGFTIVDRLNLLSNRIYVTLSFENLNDNVTEVRQATTITNSYRTHVSWYPINRKLPRVSAGFRFRTRNNGINRQNYLLPDNLTSAAVRNIYQERRQTPSGQDTLMTFTTANPRNNYSVNINASISQQFRLFNARNDVSLSFTNLKTTDKVFAYGDVISTAATLGLNSRFSDAPLETGVGFTLNATESGDGMNKVNIVGGYADGKIRLMENKLLVNGKIAITGNKTSSRMLNIVDNTASDELNEDPNDDYFVLSESADKNAFSTFVLQAGARYNITDQHSLVLDANMTNVSGQSRANDHVIQLRYVFRY